MTLSPSPPPPLSPSQYPPEANLQFDELATCFQSLFCPRLRQEIERETKRRSGMSAPGRVQLSSLGPEDGEGRAAAGQGQGEAEARALPWQQILQIC